METTGLSPNNLDAKKKIDELLMRSKITLDDVQCFSKTERDYFQKFAADMLDSLQGEARNRFFKKIEGIVDENARNEFWEQNHALITGAIAKLMDRNETMPTTSAVAKATGLSRQTVAKHLKEHRTHPQYAEEMIRFKAMSSTVLADVFLSAKNGDTRAARLYFEMIGDLQKHPSGAVVNEQNNYIQVNNTILSQENLKKLTAEQLNQIELIVTGRAGK
ncbi:MAG: hypothetical protein V4577_25660 [Bacteroidota bacterium]